MSRAAILVPSYGLFDRRAECLAAFDPEMHPRVEGCWGNVNTIGPRSCYDESKRRAETLFFDCRRQHEMPIKVIRIFGSAWTRTFDTTRPSSMFIRGPDQSSCGAV